MLKIYNTLARDKQEFVPIEAGKVRLYVCGMTVYDYCHLGHARVMVVFDVVRRCYEALRPDCDRISCSIKVDYRKGAAGRLESKVRHVEDILGRPLRTGVKP